MHLLSQVALKFVQHILYAHVHTQGTPNAPTSEIFKLSGRTDSLWNHMVEIKGIFVPANLRSNLSVPALRRVPAILTLSDEGPSGAGLLDAARSYRICSVF